MAFNPFTSFRKHQKVWMAGAVLVCMVTFVLCSGGMRGTGLDDWIMSKIRRRGSEYVSVNGTSYSQEQMGLIKNQRNIANAFMRELSNEAIRQLTLEIKGKMREEKLDKTQQFALSLRKTCLEDLLAKMHRDQRYFQGGDKIDDLVDFIAWRDLAAKNGIKVNDEVLKTLVALASHGQFWFFDSETSREIERKVGDRHSGASASEITAALKQEFEVQIAQLALATRWSQGARGEREQLANLQVDNQVVNVFLNTPMQARIAPTPEEINARYQRDRTKLTIELLPISLEALAKKVDVPSDPQKRLETLKKFYDTHARAPYHPSMEKPGFLFPERSGFQFIAADAGMEYFKQPAQAVSLLQKSPPTAFNPLSPLEGVLGWFAATPAWGATLERNLEKDRSVYEKKWEDRLAALNIRMLEYQNEKDEKRKADAKNFYDLLMSMTLPPYKNSASAWTTPEFFSPGQFDAALEKPNAETVASLVAGSSGGPLPGLVAFQQAAFEVQAKKVAPMLELDKSKRIQVGTELVLANLLPLGGGEPFTPTSLAYYAANKQQFLPIAGFIEEEQRNKIEGQLAQRWVNTAMLEAKKRLEGSVKGGYPEQVQKLLSKYRREVVDKDGKSRTISGFTFGDTPDLNIFEIETHESLKPLRDSFETYRNRVNFAEGRSFKPNLLRENDFHKLFFGSEPLGVGNAKINTPMLWPPIVTLPQERQDPLQADSQKQNFFDRAEKPVIFWKARKLDKEPMVWNPDDPKMLEFVEKQYRMHEARAKLMDEVKRAAEEIKKVQKIEGKDVVTVMRELAKEHDLETLTLNNVVRLLQNTSGKANEPAYVEYEIPRQKVPFPRADMVKNLLTLNRLEKPLKLEAEAFKELNELNESLFLAPAKGAKTKPDQVQILANEPRTAYYIATVTGVTDPPAFGFFDEPAFAATLDGSSHSFIDQVQAEYGRELMAQMSKYLRDMGRVSLSDEAKKTQAEEIAAGGGS